MKLRRQWRPPIPPSTVLFRRQWRGERVHGTSPHRPGDPRLRSKCWWSSWGGWAGCRGPGLAWCPCRRRGRRGGGWARVAALGRREEKSLDLGAAVLVADVPAASLLGAVWRWAISIQCVVRSDCPNWRWTGYMHHTFEQLSMKFIINGRGQGEATRKIILNVNLIFYYTLHALKSHKNTKLNYCYKDHQKN